VFEQALFEIPSDAGVVNLVVRFANKNVNVKEFRHWLACQAVGFGALFVKIKVRLHFVYGVTTLASSLRSKAKAGPERIRTFDPALIKRVL
jgi:hypothetical protein